ncbi:hypothetical protein E4U14_005706 [Claviceps sp. LM454 group G7]|nr:hypothetical protein E4U14_005706 [Claviceps sp. LM454 group G7]
MPAPDPSGITASADSGTIVICPSGFSWSTGPEENTTLSHYGKACALRNAALDVASAPSDT